MYYAVTGTLTVLALVAALIVSTTLPLMAIIFAVAALCSAALLIQRWIEHIENR